jgi:hypothetical protein
VAAAQLRVSLVVLILVLEAATAERLVIPKVARVLGGTLVMAAIRRLRAVAAVAAVAAAAEVITIIVVVQSFLYSM